MLRLTAFFWLLSLILLAEGVTEEKAAWLIVSGAIAVVAFLLSVLTILHKLVERGRHR